ncbi:tRNA (32-2'-O)-methyltransferase regulator THADA isoform X2 [Maniola hyperantus]|uniref:tRNA (32-2'-O)-methyltransferase regulator THADA isoform X2 n=1 Tax=Aphantopus hyperantus TaxID=2795564 RepID=UPI0021351A13
MNSNMLRIRGSENGNMKPKISITFEPVKLPDDYKYENNETFNKFISSNTEDQLVILKQILCTIKDNCDHDTVTFLAVIYLHADSSHPAKCMITRYVTKNSHIQGQFCTILTQQLESLVCKPHTNHKGYKDVVHKVGSCTVNCRPGADAVRNLEILLVGYFRDVLSYCITTLSDNTPLSPTERNEIFKLAESTLRLLLYLIHRANDDNKAKLICMFKEIRASLKRLMFDGDAPMDTKSVCGILYVVMYVTENGADSWVDILDSKHSNQDLRDLLENESSKLSLYSAIAPLVSTSKLHSVTVNDAPAFLLLTNNILQIGERSSAESTVILGVTRALVHICKLLAQSYAAGVQVLDALLVFVWAHLEHHTDSVQHLTAEALASIINYCAKLHRDGNEEAMGKLFATVSSLDRSRKSFYVSLTYLTKELGADCILHRWPNIVGELLSVLSEQALQASAITALRALLDKHVRRARSDVTVTHWIQPIVEHVAKRQLHSSELNILEKLLSYAVRLDHGVMDYILSYVKDVCSKPPYDIYPDMKCVLMLLSVARQAGELRQLAADSGHSCVDMWKDTISYDVLKMAAVDSRQENRILSISLIVESPKSTEIFARGELDFMLWFIKYNINAQTPHFRQLVLSSMKKFIRRLENSYKVLLRENGANTQPDKDQYYLRFVEDFTALCFESLVKGANYSRRYVALQTLVWLENVQLDGYNRVWTEEQVETLLYHLGDSYEINKGLALELLTRCPHQLLKDVKYTTSLDLEDIVTEVSSVKPTDCVTAVYKLKLLRSRLPENIVQGTDSTIPNRVKFVLLSTLLKEAQKQLVVCEQSIVFGARNAPMYGVLHCIGHSLEPIGPFEIPPASLSSFIQSLVTTCMQVCSCAGAVLCSAAPEGLLPDVTPQSATSDSAGGYIRLEDGGEVTAQMVLLCAWRSVKEVSLILSTTVNQIVQHDELEPATLSLWRSPDPEFNELPKIWLSELMLAIESGDSNARLCATRRSAGLPFMTQALVTTELQVTVNTKSFDLCITTLLRLARNSPRKETRCHCLNILRALYRNSQLDDIVGTYVGEGLMVALLGFESGTWIERNSATLLFSALMVRIFGVQRSKDSEKLCVRNRMTGRIFFLRYPLLYDFMLDKLKEVSANGKEQLLHPSLYPILLLLARLYPSSLEGTVSNLKLATFVPLVVSCAHAATLHTRRLAANAITPLVPPDLYISHVESMLQLLSDENIKRNFCHGILLQVLKLLSSRPESLIIDDKTQNHLADLFRQCVWIMKQCSGDVPCYVITDEYIKIINVLIRRFDSLLDETFIAETQNDLNALLFSSSKFKINPGKELCLANATYLCLIMLNIHNKIDETCRFVYKCLSHDICEVVLAVLNYLLILKGKLEIENDFQQHLCEISEKNYKKSLKYEIEKNDIKDESNYEILEKNVLKALKKDSKYIDILCDILKSSKYLECTQKCLRLMTLEPATQIVIIKAKESENKEIVNSENTNDTIIDKLIYFIKNEHENLTHVFLASLCEFLTRKLKENGVKCVGILDVLKVIFACSLSDNSCDTRTGVVEFLENNFKLLWNLDLEELSEEDQFEFKATLCATVVTTLEDDEESIRTRSSRVITQLSSSQAHHYHVIASKAAEVFLEIVQNDRKHAMALLTLIALLDFKAEVCMNDEINDECRVFDQNERYNTNLEETIWTRACVDRIKEMCDIHTKTNVYSVITDATYRQTYDKLCADHIKAYRMFDNGEQNRTDINPKVEFFYKRLNFEN